ncbi:single-stranded-DNA-specific exonuclease RecJ [Pelagibacteraceae bacterium]|nr:single-stranded-DNA-specific exonuclease RecJ [Pelagibacteraceae bacterium]
MNSVSVTGKKWVLKNFKKIDFDYLINNHSLDTTVAKLIAIKKIKKEDIENYLNPAIKNLLPNPSILKGMDKASSRTVKAIINKEKIGIFGDYDVDGASSTALLGRYFSHLGLEYETYIPDRRLEGFGLSIKGFENMMKKKMQLLFTVDCGTMSFEAIDYANKKKVDVLVLDHHQSEVKLPDAHSIVNPNQLDDKSNLKNLCAAGVCFMFLISLNRSLRKINWFTDKNIKEPDLIEYLDLVSLGTVCDVVPLTGINRAIVKQGLKILKSKKNLGLKTLLDISKVESSPTPYHLGYILGPRINAGGRVGKCSHGANLLLNKNPKDAFALATELEAYNKERQILEKELLGEAIREAHKIKDPVIILGGMNWHEGVIGIIASRIKDKFNKPTIVISKNVNVAKASARSISGFDIGTAIIAGVQEGLLLKGGGHKMAGGFSIKLDKIEEFNKFIIKKYNLTNIDHSTEKKIYIDSLISPSAINIDFFNKVNTLAPFGSGNSEPKFSIEGVKPINSKIVAEKHIKSVLLGGDGSTIKTIAFNALDSDIGAYLLKKDSKIFDIVGKISLNEWRGDKNVEFIIDDISVTKYDIKKVPSSIG